MRILSNFDTKLDEKKYAEACEQFGEENVLLIKRHPFYLFQTLWLFILVLLALSAYIGIKYFFGTSEFVFRMTMVWFLAACYAIWAGIMIFKFQKYFQRYQPNIQNRGFLNFQDGKFEYLVRSSVILFFIQFLAISGNIWLEIQSSSIGFIDLITMKVLIFVSTILVGMVYMIIRSFVRFEMDYCLVTPKYLEQICQLNFFTRKEFIINTSKIKSIHNVNTGFLDSLIGIGDIEIFSEWDGQWEADIRLDYVFDSEYVKSEILRIMKM